MAKLESNRIRSRRRFPRESSFARSFHRTISGARVGLAWTGCVGRKELDAKRAEGG
jgi:hypothetical protein